jgi:hypothetical protein
MGDHYPLCEQYISGDGLPCICELLTIHADDMAIATMADLQRQGGDAARRGPHNQPVRDAYDAVLALFDGSSE